MIEQIVANAGIGIVCGAKIQGCPDACVKRPSWKCITSKNGMWISLDDLCCMLRIISMLLHQLCLGNEAKVLAQLALVNREEF